MSENIRGRLALAIVIIMIGAFAFGLIRFFGAPVFECVLEDCGKAGPSPGASFAHQFPTWQAIVFVVWSLGLFSLWLLRSNRESRNKNRRRGPCLRIEDGNGIKRACFRI